MFTSRDLKSIISEVRPIVERQLDDATLIAGFRETVTTKGGDWSQVKALVKAMIQDERDEAGGHKRVNAMLSKAGNALGYADMLGLGNLNEKNSFAEDEPEHDADGVIIEPGAMRPQAGATADSDLATGHTPTWPLTPADAGQIAPIHKPEAALLPQTGAAEALVDQSRNVEAAAPSAADVVPTSSAGTEGEQTGNHITDLTKPNPICRDPGDCGVYASWRMPCLSCTRAAQARAA